MPTTETLTLKERITNTKKYKSMTKMQKLFAVKRTNIKKIEHALTVISNVGFEKWKSISNYHHTNINIIQELNETEN